MHNTPECRFIPMFGHLCNSFPACKDAAIVAIHICGDRSDCVSCTHVNMLIPHTLAASMVQHTLHPN